MATPIITTPDGSPTLESHDKAKRVIVSISHGIVLILSLLLIVYISYDTFKGIPFLSNHQYMTFQLWVCIVFLFDFFLELIFATDKKGYLKVRWFFFLISIPYLNFINQLNLHISDQMMFYLRFIPLLRGGYSLAMVMGYISHNRAVSLLSQYCSILAALVYILALIFYYEEHGINKNVGDFWDALYWAAMNMTTVGCYFSAVTPLGKVISVILPILGMLMLPLFTVFVTAKVKQFDDRRLLLEQMILSKGNNHGDKPDDTQNAQPATSAPADNSTQQQ